MEPTTKRRKLAPKSSSPSIPEATSSHLSHNRVNSSSQLHNDPTGIPHAERHEFEAFARHLQDAAILIEQQIDRSSYTKASVLMLSWQDDHTADSDINALEDVFRQLYGYETRHWQIPSVANPSIKLGVQIASFLNDAKPDLLLIIYYCGHGYLGPDSHLYWTCNAHEDSAKLKWDGVQCLFEDAQSDILILLDTGAVPDPMVVGSHGLKQIIGASSTQGAKSDIFKPVLTTHLTDTLRRLSSSSSFTAHDLWQQTAARVRGDNARSAPAFLTSLPIFFTLTPSKSEHLMLTPSPSVSQPSRESRGLFDSESSQQASRDYARLIDPKFVANLRFPDTRVLVCTTFVGDASPDMAYFNHWLESPPPLAKTIAVEGIFLGPPTMLLMSMPSSVWNIVQFDKVCCFLGYISSHNMLQLYDKLVGPTKALQAARLRDERKSVEQGREIAARSSPQKRLPAENHFQDSKRDTDTIDGGPTLQSVKSIVDLKEGSSLGKSRKDDSRDSLEMQAAKQLEALSHIRPSGDEGPPPFADRFSTINVASSAVPIDKSSRTGPAQLLNRSPRPSRPRSSWQHEASTETHDKDHAHSLFKQEARCAHCSHAPFKDTSSLRKHIAAAHTRPFPCAFSFAGCSSTFGSKNEWKRHIASQHLCLQYYRCSACPQSNGESKGNEFNRKDLFTQHLRRMHAPFHIKRVVSKDDSEVQAEWEVRVKEMQHSCLVTRRLPPQKSACPKPGCNAIFEGVTSWDEWTEHVGRHMERGDAEDLGVDSLLLQWALDEQIIEPVGGNRYRLCGGQSIGPTGPIATETSPSSSFPFVSSSWTSKREDVRKNSASLWSSDPLRDSGSETRLTNVKDETTASLP